MNAEFSLFILFAVTVIGFLIADLGYFNRRSHTISPQSALTQSLFWIAVSFAFGFLVFLFLGRDSAAEFMSAYVTEKMLSVDNLFVILLIFSFFKIEPQYHHRILFWGILGAIVFRAIFITAGAYIVSQFHWVLYIFGLILIYTGIKLLVEKKEEHANFHNNPLLRFVRRYLPFTSSPHGGKFFAREHGKLYATTLMMVLIIIEATDIVFAVDSIPAAFSISRDPFVIYTSNVFAILGLRALFFLIESVVNRFHHLQKGLSFVLIFIGLKMLADLVDIHISSLVSFAVIMAAFGATILLSILFPKKI
ncbi:TerC family protein [Candidatus Uhrbacteria bacterium]|nr:TerC family protein [Candidatus Uhrbacteria bacterium]